LTLRHAQRGLGFNCGGRCWTGFARGGVATPQAARLIPAILTPNKPRHHSVAVHRPAVSETTLRNQGLAQVAPLVFLAFLAFPAPHHKSLENWAQEGVHCDRRGSKSRLMGCLSAPPLLREGELMNTPLYKVLLFTGTALLMVSCASYFGQDGRRGVSSSLVDYLYPNGQIPEKYEETIPHLRLPLTVGLAFVPSQQGSSFTLAEAKKAQLLEGVKKKFTGLDYVKEIVIIPETYLRSSKGFEGVGQIARLYGLDVVALVSYDQVAVSSETKSSVLYWTIVGAYFIKGNQNQATTFVDTAVFDVNSKKMLLRAPGVSDVEQSSTLIEVDRGNREAREKGFELAMADMSNNLAIELDRFRDKIKQDKSVEVSYRQGYGGGRGGGGGIQWLALFALAGLLILRMNKR
jgi:rhombotail lipoprotein